MIRRLASVAALGALLVTAAPVAAQEQQQEMQQGAQETPMQFQQVRGQILEVKRAKVRGTDQQNVLMLLQPEGTQNRIVVDLGTGLEGQNPVEGQKIAVRGTVAQLGEQRTVLLANQAYYQNKAYDVNRPAVKREMQQPQQ